MVRQLGRHKEKSWIHAFVVMFIPSKKESKNWNYRNTVEENRSTRRKPKLKKKFFFNEIAFLMMTQIPGLII